MRPSRATRATTGRAVVPLTVAALLALTACASDSAAETAAAAPSGSSDGDGAFPVTVEHAYGETTVEQEPERVVTVGFNEQDFLLALGITPVGTREFFGYDYTTGPWAQEQLGGAEIPTVGATELDVEAVLALDPDLVLGPYSFLEQAQYDQLAAYAPTVGDLVVGEGVQSASWQDELRAIAAAVGRPEEGEQLLTETEAAFTDAVEANPTFESRSLALVFAFDGQLSVLDPQDLRMRFFTDLGFTAPQVSGAVSAENVALLDQDVVVVIGADRETLLADPLFADLDAVREDRVVYAGPVTDDFAGALGFGSPLSLPYAVDLVVPALAAATDDDPATVVGAL